MILSCENCGTRYLLSASLLGPDGRRVRCSGCGHEWYQEPPEEDAGAGDEDLEPIPESVRPVPEGSDLPAIRGAESEDGAKTRANWRVYATAAAVLFIVLGVGFVLRDTVVRMWPPALAAYELAGIPVTLPGEGLIIDRVKAEVITEGSGLNSLRVSGNIINLQQHGIDVPPLRITVRREDGTDVDTWLVKPARDRLYKEEELAFSTSLPAPPADSREVNVRLAPFATVKEAGEDGAEEETAAIESPHAL